MRARPFSGDDTPAIQALAGRLWPAGWHPGGLGWALARGDLGERVVVFDDADGQTVGWAAVGQHTAGDALAQADPAHDGAVAGVVAWIVDNLDAPRLTLPVNDADPVLAGVAEEAGFRPDHRARIAGMFCDVWDPVGAFAPGYQVRAVGDDEFDERVAVHRAAWRPASLPWTDGREVDAAAQSTFDAEAYRAVRSTWLYDQNLDLVAVAPDRSLAASCIAWFHSDTGVAEIEPLGVVPEHRGRAVAAALCTAVADRVRGLAGKQIFINTGPGDEYPAPSRAYLRAGFRAVERATVYTLERTD